jgi:hypothetical protein
MTDIRRISGGAGTYYGGDFHGFRRDADGLLYYNRADLTDSSVTVNLTDGSVLDDDLITTVDLMSNNYGGRNDMGKRAGVTYEQWLIDSNNIYFYINSNGFLVARLNQTYTYTGAV